MDELYQIGDTEVRYGVDLSTPSAGPKPVKSLRARGSDLASPVKQLRTLAEAHPTADFESAIGGSADE